MDGGEEILGQGASGSGTDQEEQFVEQHLIDQYPPLPRVVRTVPADVDLSITIAPTGADIGKPYIEAMQKWFQKYSSMAFGCLERGPTENHLHLQCVARLCTTSVTAVSTAIAKFLKALPVREGMIVPAVCAKQLTNDKLHTVVGMIGYCQKDRYQTWYDNPIRINVSDEQMRVGIEQYSIHGNEFKGRCKLTIHNIYEKAYTYMRTRITAQRYFGPLVGILCLMFQTGHYTFDPEWVILGKGLGMDRYRGNLVWKSYVEPKKLTRQEILDVIMPKQARFRYTDEDLEQLVVQQEAEMESNEREYQRERERKGKQAVEIIPEHLREISQDETEQTRVAQGVVGLGNEEYVPLHTLHSLQAFTEPQGELLGSGSAV